MVHCCKLIVPAFCLGAISASIPLPAANAADHSVLVAMVATSQLPTPSMTPLPLRPIPSGQLPPSPPLQMPIGGPGVDGQPLVREMPPIPAPAMSAPSADLPGPIYSTMPPGQSVEAGAGLPTYQPAYPTMTVPSPTPWNGSEPTVISSFPNLGSGPPPGNLGRAYKTRSELVPENKHARTGMVRIYLPEDAELSSRGLKSSWNGKYWQLETAEPLLPGVPHIYAIKGTYLRNGQKVTDVRWARLISGRIVDLDF